MKNMLILLVVTSVLSAAYAQNTSPMKRFNVFVMVANPTGDFASNSIYSEKSGFAESGFGFGFDFSKPIDKSINWMTTGSVSFNSVDASTMESMLQDYFDDVSIDVGSFRTICLFSGLQYHTPMSPTVELLLFGQAGVMLGTIPETTISIMGVEGTQKEATGTALGFGFGGGLLINNKFNLSIRYIIGEPKYTLKGSSEGESYSDNHKQPTALIQFTAGLAF